MSLAERIALVNKKIAAAARQAGREPSEVTLVAAWTTTPTPARPSTSSATFRPTRCGR